MPFCHPRTAVTAVFVVAIVAVTGLRATGVTAASPTASPAPITNPQLQTASDEVIPSIVEVIQDAHGTIRDDRDGSTHGPYDLSYSGTGFFVSNDGYLVTAAHVAAPTDAELHDELVDDYVDDLFNCDPTTSSDQCVAIESAHHDEVLGHTSAIKTGVALHVLLQSMQPDDAGLPAVLVTSSASPSRDVAVLKVDGHDEPIAVLTARAPAVGARLAVIGYPQAANTEQANLVPIITAGSVTSLVDPDSTASIAGDAHLVEIDALVRQGNSGGPGVGVDGTVLGTVSFGDRELDNFLISAADVATVLRATPARNRLGAVDAAWRDGLRAAAAHDNAAAAADFHRCADLNGTVLQCHDRAARAEAALGGSAGSRTPVEVLAALVAVIGGTVLSVRARSRRRLRAAMAAPPLAHWTNPAPPPPPPPPQPSRSPPLAPPPP